MYTGIMFPQINPVAFEWGFLVIRWYSLAYIFGLLGAWGLARLMSRKSNSVFTVLKIDDFLIWATLGVVLGGRLGYVLFYNLAYFCEFPAQILAVWQGGMSFHGGLLGVLIATFLFAYKHKLSPFSMGDILVCVAPIGLFLGRLANFANGELYGRITTSVPFAMIFPDGGDLPRHPSQLYEAALEGVALFLILNAFWWISPKYRNKTGFITGLFFVFYGLFRFIIEFTREADAHLGLLICDLSMGQLLSVPMIVLGIYFIYTSSNKRQLAKIKTS